VHDHYISLCCPSLQAQGKYWEVAGTTLGNVLGIKATDEESDGALSIADVVQT